LYPVFATGLKLALQFLIIGDKAAGPGDKFFTGTITESKGIRIPGFDPFLVL
jgi:hypothetical protein